MSSSSSWWSSSSPSLNQNRSLGACRIGPKGGVLPATVWRKAKRCHGDRAAKENLFLLLLRQLRDGEHLRGGEGVDRWIIRRRVKWWWEGIKEGRSLRCRGVSSAVGVVPARPGPDQPRLRGRIFSTEAPAVVFFFSFLFFIWVSELRLQNTYCERFDNFWTALPLGLH